LETATPPTSLVLLLWTYSTLSLQQKTQQSERFWVRQVRQTEWLLALVLFTQLPQLPLSLFSQKQNPYLLAHALAFTESEDKL
jgi:hypothetical protein